MAGTVECLQTRFTALPQLFRRSAGGVLVRPAILSWAALRSLATARGPGEGLAAVGSRTKGGGVFSRKWFVSTKPKKDTPPPARGKPSHHRCLVFSANFGVTTWRFGVCGVSCLSSYPQAREGCRPSCSNSSIVQAKMRFYYQYITRL